MINGIYVRLTLKALVKYDSGIGKAEIRDVETPRISENEVLVEVKAAGICGTDVHILDGEFPVTIPSILGHEFSGVIINKGGGVTNFKRGDRVTSETAASVCGRCRDCIYGNYNLCRFRQGFGYGGDVGGAFAHYIAIRENLLHKLPDNLSFEEGALVEPVAVALHAAVDNASIAVFVDGNVFLKESKTFENSSFAPIIISILFLSATIYAFCF